VSENLRNKVGFLEHFLSKFEHNTQKSSENLIFKHTNSNYHPVIPPSHPGYYKQDCGPKLFILFAYWPPPAAELRRPVARYYFVVAEALIRSKCITYNRSTATTAEILITPLLVNSMFRLTGSADN
jgi:hypothetical protein